MIKIENLSAYYGNEQIFSGKDFIVEKGEIVSIIGDSGCGKSTFLKCINRLIYEESGYFDGIIEYNGVDIKKINTDTLRKSITMVTQTPVVFPTSIYNNLKIVLDYHCKLSRKDLESSIVDVLKKVRLYDEVKHNLKKNASKLSGGQKQRLAIARALCCNPGYLLLDEPCSALDKNSTEEIDRLLISLKSSIGIVIVTHNIEEAKRVSNRIIEF